MDHLYEQLFSWTHLPLSFVQFEAKCSGLPVPNSMLERLNIESELEYRQRIRNSMILGPVDAAPFHPLIGREFHSIKPYVNNFKHVHEAGVCTTYNSNILLALFWRTVRFDGYKGIQVEDFLETLWRTYQEILKCQNHQTDPQLIWLLQKPTIYVTEQTARYKMLWRECRNRKTFKGPH